MVERRVFQLQNRPSFVAASEKRAPPGEPRLPPEKHVGFAIVGLGRLSLEEIIPAFALCRLAKLAEWYAKIGRTRPGGR